MLFQSSDTFHKELDFHIYYLFVALNKQKHKQINVVLAAVLLFY
jgi:hypothetical protein